MKYKNNKNAFGLDIGQTSVRMLALTRRGHKVTVSRTFSLNIEEEGFLDEAELYSPNGLGKWLHERKLTEQRFCIGLPQYLCTSRVVNDFAPSAKDAQLEQMVHFETMQLAGLSEETFLSDYQVMPPAFGIQNPVLIGFCREMVPDDAAQKAEQAGLKLKDVAMDALAAANAFFYLKPEELKEAEPQLILDIGTENATVVILAQGNVRYTGSLMFGARRFTQVIAHLQECSEQEAEKLKMDCNPDWDSPDSPFLVAVRQLETELKTAIDNWRNGELPDLAQSLIAKIWLCGGGALMPGLAKHLQSSYGCPASLFGPFIPPANPKDKKTPLVEDPAFTIAFGLALQTTGLAKYPVSLAPKLLRWQKRKEDSFKYLVTASVLFFITVIASMCYANFWISEHEAEVIEGMDELRECDALVPKLDSAFAQIEHQQKLLVPFVELGGRSKAYIRSIEEVSKALGKEDWCIYFTDEFSHKDYGTNNEEEKQPEPQPQRLTRRFREAPQETKQPDHVDSNIVNVATMPLLSKMVIGGYAAVQGNQRYKAVLSIQNKLTQCGFFSDKVDWLDENTEWTGREVEVSQRWSNFLKNNKAILGEYTEFKLKLPFKSKLVNLPPPPPPKSKKGKSSKK